MSPCPPLIITRVCPLLINPLSDPWDFNNQILSNPMEFYEDLIDVSHIQSFMVQKMLIIKGGSTRSTLTFWGGVLIRCWHCMLTFGVYWWDPCYIMLPYIAAPWILLDWNIIYKSAMFHQVRGWELERSGGPSNFSGLGIVCAMVLYVCAYEAS